MTLQPATLPQQFTRFERHLGPVLASRPERLHYGAYTRTLSKKTPAPWL